MSASSSSVVSRLPRPVKRSSSLVKALVVEPEKGPRVASVKLAPVNETKVSESLVSQVHSLRVGFTGLRTSTAAMLDRVRRRREARAKEQQSGEVLPCPPTSALGPVVSTAVIPLKSALKRGVPVVSGPRKKVSFHRTTVVHETIEMGDPSRGN